MLLNEPAIKRSILRQLGKVYDPLGILSPTMAEGKHIYRGACEEKKEWDCKQLKNVRVPRSLARNSSEAEATELNLFADASNIACSAGTIAVIEQFSVIV